MNLKIDKDYENLKDFVKDNTLTMAKLAKIAGISEKTMRTRIADPMSLNMMEFMIIAQMTKTGILELMEIIYGKKKFKELSRYSKYVVFK